MPSSYSKYVQRIEAYCTSSYKYVYVFTKPCMAERRKLMLENISITLYHYYYV